MWTHLVIQFTESMKLGERAREIIDRAHRDIVRRAAAFLLVSDSRASFGVAATRHAEFLYRCVEQTVTRDLSLEVAYLEGYDEFPRLVQEEVADMPNATIGLLIRFSRREPRHALAACAGSRVQAADGR